MMVLWVMKKEITEENWEDSCTFFGGMVGTHYRIIPKNPSLFLWFGNTGVNIGLLLLNDALLLGRTAGFRYWTIGGDR